MLNGSLESVSQILRISEKRASRRIERGLKRLVRVRRRRNVTTQAEALRLSVANEGCSTAMPSELRQSILDSIEATKGRRPASKLARRTLRALFWRRWRRRFFIGVPVSTLLLVIFGAIVWHISSRTGHSRAIATFAPWFVRFEVWRVAETARRWPTNSAAPLLDARGIRNADALYQTTNIWHAHLSFTVEEWRQLEPNRIDPLPNFIRPDGLWLLRNPQARRSGLMGVLGFEYPWTHGRLDFGGRTFTNVAVRLKGNMAVLYEQKRPFKVDLNRFTKGQKLGQVDELTFNNLCWDYSYLRDALGYEFFREAGVPAPRTAYAWLSASVAGKWDHKPLGLYLMLESVNGAFAKDRFGSKTTPVFKPVTYNLFEHLGDDWAAYAAIYNLKTEATSLQTQRVIDFARLVSFASDAEFASQLAGYLDLDEFARFLACEVLLSSFDSLLVDGQNYFLYLDPQTRKFGFIPWDLDSAWGYFWIGTDRELERASIWHPWVGENRFLERVMDVEEFRTIYRARLEEILTRLFVPERLNRRIDELAAILDEPIAAESGYRRSKFAQSVGLAPLTVTPGEPANGINHPAHQLKPFIEARARSVRKQLDGKSKGMILHPPTRR
jgi:hypothetical protein